MMRSEPDPKLRGKLRELVGRYRELADSIPTISTSSL
jgi:hypothetical protein